MKLLEKKYLVESLEPVLALVKEKKLKKIKTVTSEHYYGEHDGNDVEKFVEYPDRVEVHVFKEVNGKFTPTEEFALTDKKEGFEWLKKRGFKKANMVKMDYDKYEYKNGQVELYDIDGSLKSVILNYPEGEHEEVEKEFKLQDSEVITVPYNKYLDQIGKLRSMSLT